MFFSLNIDWYHLNTKMMFSHLRQDEEDDDADIDTASDVETKDDSAAEKPQQTSADEKVEEISKDASEKKDEL
jgi:hypothetical protein